MKRFIKLTVFAATIGFLFGSFSLHGAAPDPRPKLVLLLAEPEYKTAETLPRFAEQFLARDFRIVIVAGSVGEDQMAFDPNIDEVKTADVLLVSVKRRTPPKAQMDIIREYVRSGKPVVGIRTASHAFVLRKGVPATGEADWPRWDEEVFGGNYTGHHQDGPVTTIMAADAAHAILRGVALPFRSTTKLYKVSPLRANAQAVLTGSIPGELEQPVAYVAKHSGGGRAFYTSLGGPADFEDPSFRQLLVNAIKWAAGRQEAGGQ